MTPQQPSPLKKQLSTLSQTMPKQNAMVASQLDAARQAGLQQSIASMAPQAKAAPAAQALGQQAAAQAGQTAMQQQASNIAGQQKIGQAFIADRQREASNALRSKVYQNNKQLAEEGRRLDQLDTSLKQRLLDDTMRFQEDELGRTIFNERQLLDYKVASAKDDNALLEYEQDVTQQSQRRIAMLEMAQKKLLQALEQEYQKGEQELDQAQRKRLVEAQRALQAKIQKEQAKARNRASMISAAGSIVGAVGGAILGSAAGPGGAAAGATAGSSLGAGFGQVIAGST